MEKARELEIEAINVEELVSGNARTTGKNLLSKGMNILQENISPILYISGGEPTIIVQGDGIGGRNQEVVGGYIEGVLEESLDLDMSIICEELLKVGRAFPAESHSRQGAIMVEPESIDQLKDYIKKINAIPDVSVVDFGFSEDMLWTQPWLDDYMAAKLAECK